MTLLAPADKAELSFSHPAVATFSLTWQPVMGATGYRFVLGEASDFVRPLVDRKVTEPFVKLHGLRVGKYHWRVEALLPKGDPLVSTTASFTVRAAEGGLTK